MKFRNKKTGEKYEAISHEPIDIYFYNPAGRDGLTKRSYDSIADLNEEWEDYEPAEPLIKEQEVRDVVKLWAKANLIPHNANSIEYQLADALEGTFSEFWCNSLHIVFWSNVAPNAIHGKCYSIDELCGEEAPEPLEPSFIDLDERIREKATAEKLYKGENDIHLIEEEEC